ncbi:hypothetical protein PGT21_004966 [Puccinia graminis f. sp. tritici]|uniref:Uncharacterized protein n=1 Tax=Puccinia graminis f. sp. tritici TaxID=56615 RepID=A0A5B0QEM9_PUCGR|nr:hypothetical protein PGT21_004966 [Puccinia graminis f. sp. tritici]
MPLSTVLQSREIIPSESCNYHLPLGSLRTFHAALYVCCYTHPWLSRRSRWDDPRPKTIRTIPPSTSGQKLSQSLQMSRLPSDPKISLLAKPDQRPKSMVRRFRRCSQVLIGERNPRHYHQLSKALGRHCFHWVVDVRQVKKKATQILLLAQPQTIRKFS